MQKGGPRVRPRLSAKGLKAEDVTIEQDLGTAGEDENECLLRLFGLQETGHIKALSRPKFHPEGPEEEEDIPFTGQVVSQVGICKEILRTPT